MLCRLYINTKIYHKIKSSLSFYKIELLSQFRWREQCEAGHEDREMSRNSGGTGQVSEMRVSQAWFGLGEGQKSIPLGPRA